MNEPQINKDKKTFNKNWTWIITLFAFLIGTGIAQYYNDRKAYQTVRNAMPNATIKFNSLSQEEQNRIYELREKAFQIVYNHLDDQDKAEYANLFNGGMKTDADFARNDALLNKVKPKLNEEEKAVLNDFYQVVKELTGIKAKKNFF